ncbi:hypothetical protein IG631_02436 [Alternaria alternata]|nr:hypothetical protein IG631_02436 [Alternaria alternata]
MRVTAVVTAAVLASSATAAPTPGLISSILGLLTNDINKLLSSLGIHLHTDGANHGATVPFHDQCPFSIPVVDLSPIRHSHDINWGKGVNGGNFINWKTFKANGANLGGWLEKEQTHDPIWWSEVGGDGAPDEWTLCQNLGSKCASVFEERYASFINTTTIDQLANVGVNTLRIPLTYAAFIEAVDGVLNFIKQSGHVNAFTIAPINEASDNFAGFGSAAGLTINGTNWINTYFSGVLKKIAKVDKRIPMMIQDCFMGASYWAPFYDASENIVFDSHVYYFAAAGTYAGYVNPAVCGQAQYIAQETKFPVFVGEWSLQAMYNNTLNTRKTIFDTQRYAWNKYLAGGAFWNGVSYATAKVDGEGTQREYWSYIDLINQGVITKSDFRVLSSLYFLLCELDLIEDTLCFESCDYAVRRGTFLLGSNNRLTFTSHQSSSGSLMVGNEVVHVHEFLISSSSEFFKNATKPEWRTESRPIDLSDEQPHIFRRYCQWLYSGHMAPDLPEKSIFQCLAYMYVLGEKIVDYEFQNAVIQAIISDMGRKNKVPSLGTIKIIYDGTTEGSAARRLLVDS